MLSSKRRSSILDDQLIRELIFVPASCGKMLRENMAALFDPFYEALRGMA